MFSRKGGRRGLQQRYGTPATEGTGDVSVYKAKILSVDKVRYVCTIQSEFDNCIYEDVPIEPQVLTSEGGGSFWMPETNSVVWACGPSTGSTPFIMSGASMPQQTEGGEVEDPADRRMNRPVVNEGDHVLAQNATGRVILRKGGMVEIGAGEVAQTRYIPLTNLIEHFCLNWRNNTGAGLMEVICRDRDGTYGPDRTPAEFKFDLREFCEDDFPSMDLRIGRIQDEDDQAIPGGDIGAVIARLTFDNKATWWVDREGNIAKRVMGASHESYHQGRKVYTVGNVRDVVNGLRDEEYLQRQTKVNTTDSLEVGRDRKVRIAGNLEESVAGSVLRSSGAVTEQLGDVTRNVDGGVVESVVGQHAQDVGGNRTVTVGGDSSETVAGAKNLVVGSANSVNPLSPGYQVTVQNGGFQVHSTVGNLVFSTGSLNPAAASSRLVIKPNGAFVLSSGLGAVEIEQNPTGIRLSTPGGVISLDSSGTVLLGPGPVRGQVLTTLTLPADLTTGVPTTGSPNVQVGSTGALPGPAALPSTFIPDVTP